MDEKYKEFLLAALRRGSLRAKLMDAELTAIGVALRSDFIGPDQARDWILEEGLMWLVGERAECTAIQAAVDVEVANASAA